MYPPSGDESFRLRALVQTLHHEEYFMASGFFLRFGFFPIRNSESAFTLLHAEHVFSVGTGGSPPLAIRRLMDWRLWWFRMAITRLHGKQ